jgi:hypothetical protein
MSGLDNLIDAAPETGARAVTHPSPEATEGRASAPTEETAEQPGETPLRPAGYEGQAGVLRSQRVARIRCLDQVKARGFTFGKGKVVEGVPLAHAEYLAAGGKAEILEVS